MPTAWFCSGSAGAGRSAHPAINVNAAATTIFFMTFPYPES
jgi:hypothetical protein